jgi:ribose transport system ATP-binding protein
MGSKDLVIRMSGIGKRYSAVEALKDVSLECFTSSIHAIVGENGAGKSTLIKIIAGVTQPNTGSLFLDDALVQFRSPLDAIKNSILSVFQELSIIPDLTVAENICMLAKSNGPHKLISGNSKRRKAEEVLSRIKCYDIDPRELCSDLPLSRLQLVEIAKALACNPRILILDEATSALAAADSDKIFELCGTLREQGVSILYITHHLREVDLLADTCSVFRNGERIETFSVGTRSQNEIISMMIGRPLSKLFPEKKAYPADKKDKTLTVKHLSWYNKIRDVSFTLSPGEIVGLGGIDGQGQKDLLFALFGVLRHVRASVQIGTNNLSLKGPSALIDSADRVVMIPEDRKREGLFPSMSILKNVSLASLSRFSAGPFINRQKETEQVLSMLQSLHVKVGNINDSIDSLSGGNQQKVILAKWLLLEAQCLLLNDPTRGIDVPTKQDIYALLRGLADKGKSILIYTTDYDELIGLCDRVIIMYKGQVKKILVGNEISESNILTASLDLQK